MNIFQMKGLTLVLLSLIISISIFGQTVKIKVKFVDDCYREKNLYEARLKVNDTLEFKQYINEPSFEFNIPKFLLQNGEIITVNAERLSENEINGTICLPFISSCSSKHETKIILVDSLFDKKELSIELSVGMGSTGCGSYPYFRFPLNSNDINLTILDFDNCCDTIMIIKEKWLVYCLVEKFRLAGKLKLEGSADLIENNSERLALQRAEKIKSLLVENGMDENSISITAKVYDGRKSDGKYPLTKEEILEKQRANANVHISYW